MVRKRKIPVRKHHGIRDPLKQLEEREKKLKNVVNNPPEQGNDQKVSFKFSQFQKLVNDTKTGKKVKRIHRGQEDKPAVAKTRKGRKEEPESKIRNIKQFKDEADEDYLKRVNRMTTESLREAQYEAKYGVTVVHDRKTGAISIKKRPKNEIDELLKQKQNDRLGGKTGRKGNKKPTKPMDPKLAKELIKQAIKEDNEEKIKEKAELEEYKRDEIKFGEVVHAPPTLSTLPRKAQRSETVPRPGKKDNLLLKSMLNETNSSSALTNTNSKTPQKEKKTGKVTKAQLKGKRKDLPAATRSMLESERNKFVEIYRNLKKSKEKAMQK